MYGFWSLCQNNVFFVCKIFTIITMIVSFVCILLRFECLTLLATLILYYSKFDKHQNIIFNSEQCKTPRV